MIVSSLQSIVILHHWLHCDNYHTKHFVDLICSFLFYQSFCTFVVLLLDDFIFRKFFDRLSSIVIVWIFLFVCFFRLHLLVNLWKFFKKLFTFCLSKSFSHFVCQQIFDKQFQFDVFEFCFVIRISQHCFLIWRFS